ncbi:SGNH/GDSL hydrolase family protein [Xanthobacter autotrophicus DSM 597]|uniref:SGNH/GDSL hydrolase family protein n=1 Tax=Xanthobacter wiegelii TaxID=3119913 RepID=UPI003727380E
MTFGEMVALFATRAGLKKVRERAEGAASLATNFAMGGPANQQYTTIGDSRMAYMYGGASTPRSSALSANSVMNMANALLGQRMTPLANYAVPGERHDEYLARLPQALASGAGYIVIHGYFNDIQFGLTADQIWNGYSSGAWSTGLKAALDACRAAGRRVILFTETGGGGGPYQFDLTKLRETLKINQRLREYAWGNNAVILIDAAYICWEPSATTQITHRSGYFDDYVHWNHFANWMIAKALAAALLPVTVPAPCMSAAGFEYQSALMEGINAIQNGLFLTTTGGPTLPTGITGVRPANWTYSRVGVPTADMSLVANADGYGNDLVVAATFTQRGEQIILSQSISATHMSPGDILRAGCVVKIDAGATNYWGSFMRNEVLNTTMQDFNVTTSLGPSGAPAVAGPDDARLVTHRTAYCVVPDAAGNFTWTLRLVSAGAGSVTARISRCWERQQFTAV